MERWFKSGDEESDDKLTRKRRPTRHRPLWSLRIRIITRRNIHTIRTGRMRNRRIRIMRQSEICKQIRRTRIRRR